MNMSNPLITNVDINILHHSRGVLEIVDYSPVTRTSLMLVAGAH